MFNGLAIIRKWAADHKIQDTTKRLQPKAPDSLSLSGHQLGSPLRYHLQCSSKVPEGVEAALTQTVTHIGFGLGGNNGTVSVQQYFYPQRKGYKSAQWSGKHIQAASHNPEVEGSNPSPATTLCDQKRYRTGKPRSRNGFGVFSRPFLTARKKDIFPPLPRAVRTWTKTESFCAQF